MDSLVLLLPSPAASTDLMLHAHVVTVLMKLSTVYLHALMPRVDNASHCSLMNSLPGLTPELPFFWLKKYFELPNCGYLTLLPLSILQSSHFKNNSPLAGSTSSSATYVPQSHSCSANTYPHFSYNAVRNRGHPNRSSNCGRQ